MLEQVSISFLFHLCRFVRVQFVRIRHFFVRIQLNVCAAIDDCCADIVGILCCVLGSLVSPWWDCFFSSALCGYRRILCGYRRRLCGNIKRFVRKRKVRCVVFFSSCRCRLLLVSLLFFSFSAKEEHVVKGKVIEYHPVLLDVAPMERIGGWSLEGEDPSFYTQDQLWKGGRRDWPEIPLPTATAPAGGARPKTTSAPVPDDDVEDSQPRGPFHPSDPQVKDLLQIHHSMVKIT